MEIERKWLLLTIPDVNIAVEHAVVQQFYVSVNPEVRLRTYICGGEGHIPFRLAIKSNGTLSREEIQTEVDERFYQEVKRFIAKPAIIKDFYIHRVNGYDICTSIVDPYLPTSFIYAEVEFDSEEEAFAYEFPWPELVVREVTEDSLYKMKNYWMRTRCFD